ncbi:MAG TPA: EscV/YscV/HrcV family type III secretion system export apparatus protein, partial [Phycisphaerales bacterium]|nr:EscV/YscV/HrcV family type III secretion system export apparatus protein [Phycisphaerales bacterium]
TGKQKTTPKLQHEKEPPENLLELDRISVQVGVRLIKMVDPKRENSIFDRIGALRRRFAQQLGIIIPLVRLRDNIDLEPTAYQIRLYDHTVASGKLEPDMLLAMDSGAARTKIKGIETAEPVYGLPALWISPKDKDHAELNGYTVIDPESVFITHLSETLRNHAHELLSREDVQMLVDRLRKTQPALVGDVVGDLVPVGLLQQVLRNLLKDRIPIRELPAILESLGENASRTKNPAVLTEAVRKRLGRTITEQYKGADGKISAITLHPALEHQITAALQQQGDQVALGLPAEVALELSRNVAQAWKAAMEKGTDTVVLLCDSAVRPSLASMLARTVPSLPVVAYDEITLGTEITVIETISAGRAQTDPQQQQLAPALKE